MPTLGTLKAQRALAVRHHGADSDEAREAAKTLAAEKVRVHIARLLADAPPLSDEQRAELYELLRPIRQAKAKAIRDAVRNGGAV